MMLEKEQICYVENTLATSSLLQALSNGERGRGGLLHGNGPAHNSDLQLSNF